MKITVYGSAICSGCKAFYKKVKEVAEKNGISADLLYESDLKKAMEKGIMELPALEVEGIIKSSGRALKEKEIQAMLGCPPQ
ncbi:MAG: thioredoxin family protein [Clostridia bacterium]|nr:thioredoxin family protein [Clostridia bacterium]